MVRQDTSHKDTCW